MKTKRTITILTLVVAIAVMAAFGIFRNTQPVQAQTTDPEGPQRISFGMVGITAGQTVRIGVSNTILDPLQFGPYRVVLNFRGANGQLIRNRNGEVIRRSVELRPGDSTFLDVDFGEIPPPVGDRMQLRAVIAVQPPPVGEQPPPIADIVSTVEVINNANGRTVFALSGLPSIRQTPPPVANQPSGQ